MLADGACFEDWLCAVACDRASMRQRLVLDATTLCHSEDLEISHPLSPLLPVLVSEFGNSRLDSVHVKSTCMNPACVCVYISLSWIRCVSVAVEAFDHHCDLLSMLTGRCRYVVAILSAGTAPTSWFPTP